MKKYIFASYDYLIITFGCIVYALGLTVFIYPNNTNGEIHFRQFPISLKNSPENIRKSLQKQVILLTKQKKNGIIKVYFSIRGSLRFFPYVGLGRILAVRGEIRNLIDTNLFEPFSLK